MLIYGNYFFTAVFAVESFAKMAAMSPRYFFAVTTLINVVFFIKSNLSVLVNCLIIIFQSLSGWLERFRFHNCGLIIG